MDAAPPYAHPGRLWSGVSLGVLLVFTAANAFLLLHVGPVFGQIFRDMGPNVALPLMTVLFLSGRVVLVCLDFTWLLLSTALLRQNHPHVILLINLGILLSFAQGLTTVFALMEGIRAMPDIVGMANP